MKRDDCSMAPLLEAQRDGRLGDKEAASFARHLALCAECQAHARALDEVRAQLRTASAPPLAPLEHQRRRLALLRSAATPPSSSSRARPRLVLLAAPALVALAVIGAIFLRRAPEAVPLARLPQASLRMPERTVTTVESAPGTRFERLAIAGGAGGERVALTDGAVDLSVKKLAPGERFIVATSDAEVEVRGTIFQVEAKGGRIAGVVVTEGKVEVRHRGAISLIAAGGVWKPPVEPAPEAAALAAGDDAAIAAAAEPKRELPGDAGARARMEAPKVAARAAIEPPKAAPRAPIAAPKIAPRAPVEAPKAAPRAPVEAPKIAQRAGSGASKDFASAMGLIERGDYGAAAERLDAFSAANPADGRAEDAAFLAIVSLQRAGRSADAAEAARRYLARYPRGDRRAEAEAVAKGAR